MAVGVVTLLDATKREDLTGLIANISPTETPLLAGLQTAQDATAVLHEFPGDTFATAADNAQTEGFGFTVVDEVTPTRNTNLAQIFGHNIQVSRTQQLIDTVQGNTLAYQLGKNLTEHAKDIELSLMQGTRASGSTDSARRMDGIQASISTMKTARDSGGSLSEVIFNDIMEMVKGVTDEVVDEVYCGATLKRDISQFTGRSNTRFILPADDRRSVNVADKYQSDWGTHTIFWHRNVGNGANAKDLIGINTKYWAISWLDRTHTQRLPLESIDRMRAQIVSELTLEDRAESSSFVYQGFTG